jgi:uncharacterized membrane protein
LQGEVADFQSPLLPLSRNRSSLLGVAETLAPLAFIWFAISGALYLGLVGRVAPPLQTTMWGDIAEQITYSQFLAYLALGLVLAGAVFALSVVAVPMIVDRHVDASTAMRMSLLFMIAIFPLLGHASWRAYKELVVE